MQRLLLAFLLQIVCLTILAIPARRTAVKVTLPDGTKREVVIRGDERCHWLETPDGQSVGERVYSHALIERYQLANAEYHKILQYHNGQRREAFSAPVDPSLASKASAPAGSMLLEGSFPTKGKRRLLALLINFANTTPTFSREQFDAMLNEEDYNGSGSFRDYYLDQSCGQLDIQTTVTPWITVSQAKQYYNIDNTPSLIAEALKQIEGTVNLRDFDNDGDGILDGLIVIHAGEGQEASGNATDIWSHSSTIYGMQQDGVSLFRYTIEPEVLHGQPSTIGVFCHEFGHNLGALDYYDTNYSSGGAYGGTGPWDIMGEGAWNGSGGLGTHPAPFTAWQRWQFGWTKPLILNESQHVEAIAAGAPDADSYIMHTTSEGDYFVFENIQHTTPWTSDIPGHGLIITHVIESIVRQRMAMNNLNATYPQGIYTVCADAHSDPQEGNPSSYGDLTSSATPFPGSRSHTTFSDETLPSTHSQDGRFSYIALRNIVESDGLVSFDFIQGNAPQKPVNLTATVAQGTVQLSWTFPAAAELPVSCNIYRADVLLGSVNEDAMNGGTFQFSDPATSATGLVTYSVDATYAGGLTSALASVSTRIPPQVADGFNGRYDAEKQSFEFSWKIPNELTRCVNDLHYELVDHHATSFRYAHRFRADDLQPYIGKEIRSITFLPQQRSTEASYDICVWRTKTKYGEAAPMTLPADGLEIVASRRVNEFSPSYLRTTPFVTRPVIERGYDYFIGVEMTSNGLAEIVTDQAELQNGYGNMMSINGGAWQPDPLAKGNYILSATLAGEMPWMEMASLLVVPGSTTAPSTLFSEFFCPYDAATDLFMPLGFTLYADGQRVAETTGTSMSIPANFIASDGDGVTTFQLVSAYKQHNESRPVEVKVQHDIPEAITSTTTDNDAASFVIYDLSGRQVNLPVKSRGICIQGGKKICR